MNGTEWRNKMSVLTNIEPMNVFKYFEEICAIPHGSDNTSTISQYCVDFAKSHDLKYVQDELGNVIIYKPASAGYEASKPIILQGHLDMVCEKNFESDSKHDFEKDGLRLAQTDDFIYAKGTTLGADDGIAVAICLAILEDDSIKHPPLEILLTVDEEIGMLGINALDFSKLSAKRMINIDNEKEGELLVSSAGGMRSKCSIPVRYVEKSGSKYNIVLCGLRGGHSGSEIDKYRGNANILMGRLLHFIGKNINFDLCYLKGGLQDNAIPREAQAEILVHEKDAYEFEELISRFEATIQNEFRIIEKNITIYCEDKGPSTERALTAKTKERVVFLLMTIPDGVQKMSPETDSLVQTSLNAGIMRLRENSFNMQICIRSSVSSEKYALGDKLKYLTETIGGTYSAEGDYPAWEYNSKSELRDIMFRTYQQCMGHNPTLAGIHAGLECGIAYKNIPGVDIVSIGPDIDNIHTPKEKLSIPSTQRIWMYLLKVLENCK
jgi:dipeptidase D